MRERGERLLPNGLFTLKNYFHFRPILAEFHLLPSPSPFLPSFPPNYRNCTKRPFALVVAKEAAIFGELPIIPSPPLPSLLLPTFLCVPAEKNFLSFCRPHFDGPQMEGIVKSPKIGWGKEGRKTREEGREGANVSL